MSCVSVTNVTVRNNPAPVTADLEFEISFECLQALAEDIEWKVIYVGCPQRKELDQELDAIDLGPISVGTMKFVFQAPHPKFEKIPADDIVGVAAVMLSASYKNQEFIRIGYYVNNYYDDQELVENPPEIPDLSKLKRLIIQENPRVTRFNIEWDSPLADASAVSASPEGMDVDASVSSTSNSTVLGNGTASSTAASSKTNSPGLSGSKEKLAGAIGAAPSGVIAP